MKLLLLDLDGTVREPISDNTFITNPEDQRLIKGVEEKFKEYNYWTVIGVTNQGGVAAGHKTLENCIAEQYFTLELAWRLEAILFCPDVEGKECWVVESEFLEPYCVTIRGYNFRKPGAGMLDFAHRLTWNWEGKQASNSIEESLMVGDIEEDKLAAKAANIPFMWAKDWRDDK